MQACKSHSVAILLFDGVMPLDVTGPTDALMVANYYWRKKNKLSGDEQFYRYRFISADTQSVTSLSGLRFVADATITTAEPNQFEAFLVPGGNGVFKAAKNPELLTWIRRAHKLNSRTISVCSGSWVLATAGILAGHRACSHWTLCSKLAERFPDINVDPDSLYLADGKIISSAGVTSGIDMTLALIEADLGRDIALKVARRLVVHLKRPGTQSQFSWPLKAQEAGSSDAVGKAVTWLLDHLREPVSVEKLAEKAGMSLRTFSRRFRAQTGKSPAKFIEYTRLENARLLLEENQSIALAQAAAASGFSSTEHLTRSFERRFGIHPGQYRTSFKLQ